MFQLLGLIFLTGLLIATLFGLITLGLTCYYLFNSSRRHRGIHILKFGIAGVLVFIGLLAVLYLTHGEDLSKKFWIQSCYIGLSGYGVLGSIALILQRHKSEKI